MSDTFVNLQARSASSAPARGGGLRQLSKTPGVLQITLKRREADLRKVRQRASQLAPERGEGRRAPAMRRQNGESSRAAAARRSRRLPRRCPCDHTELRSAQTKQHTFSPPFAQYMKSRYTIMLEYIDT